MSTAIPPRGLTRKPSSSLPGTCSPVPKYPSEIHLIRAPKAALASWRIAGNNESGKKR